MHRPLFALVLCAVTARVLAADTADEIKGFAPVTVSSANYRTTPRAELLRAVEDASPAINPEAPTLQPLKKPQRFVFVRGEIFDSDLTYEQVTALLTTALAKKGYLNGVDARGRIYDPENIDLLLRVSYGTRLWRLPTVRTQGLNYDDGMIARPRGLGLQLLGGEQSWDQRAGGNDDALTAMANNDANPASGGFSSASSRAAPGQVAVDTGAGSAALLPGGTDFGSTREFHLIVVDAFDYHELRQNGRDTKRLWSTFVSAPKQPRQNFSSVAAALARNAMPYFGETTHGLQVYSDARAEVKIGELIEVRDEPKK